MSDLKVEFKCQSDMCLEFERTFIDFRGALRMTKKAKNDKVSMMVQYIMFTVAISFQPRVATTFSLPLKLDQA